MGAEDRDGQRGNAPVAGGRLFIETLARRDFAARRLCWPPDHPGRPGTPGERQPPSVAPGTSLRTQGAGNDQRLPRLA
jgi:hypothetical protein